MPILLDREMHRPPTPAGDSPPYEKVKHLPNKEPGLYSFPLSTVETLSLCWTSLEKSSLCFNVDTLQQIFNGPSREKQNAVFLAILSIFLFRTKAYTLTQELSLHINFCPLLQYTWQKKVRCALMQVSPDLLFCDIQSRSVILNLNI